ncbi:MAG: SDR family oxidoreductase [Alphaproteobacteria bacterium]|nr:SDR family oxidoreductase [Alphaproteobacteria bacterium]
MFDLSGRVALVTGGNGGIGLAMAQGLAAHGARVAIAGRNAEKNAAALAALGDGAFLAGGDLTAPGAAETAVAEVLSRAGRLDILVNNAGTNIRRRPEDVTDAEWGSVIDINLNALMRMTRAAYPALKASGAVSLFGVPFSPAYAASKGAVLQYTKAIATAWATEGITANAVLPGWIDTELTQGARREVGTLHDSVLARTPMKRWGRPDDLAAVAVFLASEEARFVTGTGIPVDGGYAAVG